MFRLRRIPSAQQRPPSIRRRWVTRAKFLIGYALFLQDIERSREAWGEQFPHFAIVVGSEAPQALSDGIAYPPALTNRLAAEAAGRLSPEALQAHDSWRASISDLHARWFPPRYYPPWSVPEPAAPFIATCLLCRPVALDDDWLDQYGIVSLGVPITWHLRRVPPPGSPYHALIGELRARLRRDGVIDRAGLDDAIRTVALAQGEALQQALAEADHGGAVDLHGTIDVFPGMSYEDLKGVREELIACWHAHRRALVRLALMEHDRSVRAAANLLGLDRGTVKDIADCL